MRIAIFLLPIMLFLCAAAVADKQETPPGNSAKTHRQTEPQAQRQSQATKAMFELNIRSLNQTLNVGDPIPIEFSIKNIGSNRYSYLDRNYDRGGRMPEYELSCISQSGTRIEDPRKNNAIATMGGLAQKAVLEPGQTFYKTIFLNRWAKLPASGTYHVTGIYHLENDAGSVESKPIDIVLHPRTPAQMKEYVRSLESKLPGAKTTEETELIFQQLMFTLDPSIIPQMIDWMYCKPRNSYWLSEALSFYFPKDKVKPQLLRACIKRGLPPGSTSSFYNMERTKDNWIVHPLTDEQWRKVIARSLASDNKVCWAEGCLSAQSHPDDSHTARLIAIATDPKSEARMQAIYALAMNRTEDSVRTLKQLINDSDESIKQTTKSAIQTAYRYKGNEVPGRRLLESDFDQSIPTGH